MTKSRAVDKLIAALKTAGRDDEVAVVQEMRSDITPSHVSALRRKRSS